MDILITNNIAIVDVFFSLMIILFLGFASCFLFCLFGIDFGSISNKNIISCLCWSSLYVVGGNINK